MKKSSIILAAIALLLLLSFGVYIASIVIAKFGFVDQQLEERQENRRTKPAADTLSADSSRYPYKAE